MSSKGTKWHLASSPGHVLQCNVQRNGMQLFWLNGLFLSLQIPADTIRPNHTQSRPSASWDLRMGLPHTTLYMLKVCPKNTVRSGSLQINSWSVWPFFLEPYCYHVARKEGSWDHAAATITRIINLAWSKFLCVSKVPWEREQPGLADRLSEHLRDEISNWFNSYVVFFFFFPLTKSLKKKKMRDSCQCM